MPIMINVVTMRVQTAETASQINVAEVVTSARTLFSKRNLGYGFNVGHASIIPSQAYLFDQDFIDSPVVAPVVASAGSTGA